MSDQQKPEEDGAAEVTPNDGTNGAHGTNIGADTDSIPTQQAPGVDQAQANQYYGYQSPERGPHPIADPLRSQRPYQQYRGYWMPKTPPPPLPRLYNMTPGSPPPQQPPQQPYPYPYQQPQQNPDNARKPSNSQSTRQYLFGIGMCFVVIVLLAGAFLAGYNSERPTGGVGVPPTNGPLSEAPTTPQVTKPETVSVTLSNTVKWDIEVKAGYHYTVDPSELAKFVPQHDVNPLIAIAPQDVSWSKANINRTIVIAQPTSCELVDSQDARYTVQTTLGERAPLAKLTSIDEGIPAQFWAMNVTGGDGCAPIMAQEGTDIDYFQYLVTGGSHLR